MNLGLLQCGNFTSKLIEEYGPYPSMFKTLFSSAGALEYEIYTCLHGQFPESPDVCDAWLITGSKYGAYDPIDWIMQLESFIRALYAAQKKTIGICFGHQIMAQAMGGRVVQSSRSWGVGVSFNQIALRKPWMKPYCDTFDIVSFHQDQIIDLPKNVEVLAGNAFCPYYMLQYDDCFLSIQGHPELSLDFVRSLFDSNNFQIEPSRVREALISLHAPIDSERVACWMMRFLTDES